MGYRHYVAEITIKGEASLVKKAVSFLNAFHAGEDGTLAEDEVYQTFKEEMKELWGVPDEDYYGTSAFDLELGGHTGESLVESFCRYETENSGSYYYEPLFSAFPDLEFTFEGDTSWYNNAGEAQENRLCEYAEYFDGMLDYASHDFWGYGAKCASMEDCLEAISNNFYAIEAIPDSLKTEELYLAVISEGIGPEELEYFLEYVPKNLKAKVKAALKG